jgi:hypothetical protein
MAVRGKTIAKSFRVSEHAFHAIGEDAARQRVSVNTLVNQLFLRYADFDRYAVRAGAVVISNDSLRRILESADEDALRAAGKAAGGSMGRATILARDGTLSRETIMGFLRSLADYANFFEYSEVAQRERTTVTLIHGLGQKWTTFISHYLQSLFEDVGLTPTFTLGESSIVLEFEAG